MVEALRARNGWLRAPLYALGAADAGAMALGLARYLPLEVCIDVQVLRPPSYITDGYLLEQKQCLVFKGRT